MAFKIKNEQVEDWMLLISDRFSTLKIGYWYSLVVALAAALPLFLFLKYSFSSVFISQYQPPEVVTVRPQPQPIKLVDHKIFELSQNSYSGLVRIRNINLEQGIPELIFTAEFKTFGNTAITKVSGKTFVLPASEKILVFSKFTSDQTPELLDFKFEEPKFRYKPQLPPLNLELERVSIENPNGTIAVSGGIKNLSPFTIKQIYLPMLLYDSSNRIVGVNSTTVNLVKSSEVRTFRYIWPKSIPEAVRAEVTSEVNLFESGILITDEQAQRF
ncbi:MAG: hypothetical protein A3H72_01990 [Candidatus Doudnabacteria bacterium RIFCSPLOWO2_02_FULL_48_8]|nr:MAG: hypothetical protein A3E98_00775 [Candidatus Doudnabacteria bacterium RIFCSPHIGHO2_12_FULL_48_11]OGE95779.1 MAG: hypothetical protein A3H72_01990 [Candidatus Doudnabacteria bacterium RIFCSPLOWO2_02_FULL_48_8]